MFLPVYTNHYQISFMILLIKEISALWKQCVVIT